MQGKRRFQGGEVYRVGYGQKGIHDKDLPCLIIRRWMITIVKSFSGQEQSKVAVNVWTVV